MQLLKARVWSVVDIGMLKWCCFLAGMIAGAFLADFTRRHVWAIGAAALLLAIRPTLSFFRDAGA